MVVSCGRDGELVVEIDTEGFREGRREQGRERLRLTIR